MLPSANKPQEVTILSRRWVLMVLLMPEALSGDVRWVCMVRWAQRPPSVSLQPAVKVRAPALLSHVVPQLPQVRLICSQMQGTVHLWTQERRIQNTSHKTSPPHMWRRAGRGAVVKWRRCNGPQTTKEMFPEALCTRTSKDVLFIIKFYHT